jgi:integrase
MADSVTLVPSKLTLYRRTRSGKWQCRYKLKNGDWYRESTKETDLNEAKDIAFRLYYSAEERVKNNLPQNTRNFKHVADLAVTRMKEELKADTGKVVYNDYIRVIEKYLIPFFGKRLVSSIRVGDLQEYADYRDQRIAEEQRDRRREALKKRIKDIEKLTKELEKLDSIPISFKAKQSTINTHNSALNRVFDEALLYGWITETIKPTLLNKGTKGESRGTFTLEEYEQITLAFRRAWWRKTDDKRMQHLRKVLREYVLILANTGIRHGTEALSLKWNSIELFTEKDEKPYYEFNVDGKRGKRKLIARDGVERFLRRLAVLYDDVLDPEEKKKKITEIDINKVLAEKKDIYLFRWLEDDEPRNVKAKEVIKPDALRQLFRNFLTEHDLLTGADGKARTLYSLRHMYATFGLINGRDIYVLALQMGTSVKMLEQYYSKLQPRLRAKELSGRIEKIARIEGDQSEYSEDTISEHRGSDSDSKSD